MMQGNGVWYVEPIGELDELQLIHEVRKLIETDQGQVLAFERNWSGLGKFVLNPSFQYRAYRLYPDGQILYNPLLSRPRIN